MDWKIVASLMLCGTLACEDTSTPPPTFVIHGTVATGAHTRTPLSGGYVGLLMPQGAHGGHWIGMGFDPSTGLASKTTIRADGTYTFTMDSPSFDATHDFPLFLAASDAAQTFTMLSEIPKDLGVAGADLAIDINPTTTIASEMICPGGVNPPPGNTWCYSDPKTAGANEAAMIGILETALSGDLKDLETGSPPSWSSFASGFLNDPATFTEIKTNLTGQGITFGAATPTSIASTLATAPLPLVKPPGSGGGGGPSGGGCRLVWDCGTSSQCASVYGGKTGSLAEPDGPTCASVCKSSGACTCQGC